MNYDFTFGTQHARIVAVPCGRGWSFGYKVVGRVWESDYNRNKNDIYILVGVYVPYVDIIGWVGRDTLAEYRTEYKTTAGYELQEVVTRSMDDL